MDIRRFNPEDFLNKRTAALTLVVTLGTVGCAGPNAYAPPTSVVECVDDMMDGGAQTLAAAQVACDQVITDEILEDYNSVDRGLDG